MISMPRYLQQHQQVVDSTVNSSMAFQQQMFAALAAAAAGGVQGRPPPPSSQEQQVQHTTRVEILGQFGLSTLHLLGTISPFLNQTICNCNKLQIDRQRPAAAAAADPSSSLLFPPEQVWKSFCDEVDDSLRLANFANALGRYGIIILCLVEIILWVVSGASSTGSITFEFYVYLLPLCLLVPLVGTVFSVTLTSVQYLKNTCQIHSLKSFGRFRYVLEEGDVTVLPHRKKKKKDEEEGGLGVGEQQLETSTALGKKRRGYYITIETLDTTAGIGGGALGGILGNMEMGGVMTGGTNTTSAASGGNANADMPSFPISNHKIGGDSLFDQLQSK